MTTCYNYDPQYGQVEEIVLQPVGGYTAQHIAPMAFERNKIVIVNVCSCCNTIGGAGFHFLECEYCGGEVMPASKKAKWVPTIKRVDCGRKWLFGKKIIKHEEVGGRWVFC